MTGEPDRIDVPIGQLARLYAAAHYFVVVGRREWLFQVGQPAADVERQLCAARYQFVTAWNPHSNPAGEHGNLQAGEALEARLQQAGLVIHRALGCDARGGAVEHGWLIQDQPPDHADALARDFGQAGTLYWQAGEPVRLRMQHARPHEFAENSFIDWIS